MIFWTGCLLGEYSKDCSIKLSLLPHLKAQAILIRNGKPLALQRLKYLHVPQRVDKPPRHAGVPHLPKARSAGRHPGCPSPSLLARPPARLLRRGGGRNQTRGRGSPRETREGKGGLLLAMLLCHVSSRVPPDPCHTPGQPGAGVGPPSRALLPVHNRSLPAFTPMAADGSLSRQHELYEKLKPSPMETIPSSAAPEPGPSPGHGPGGRSAHPLWPARAVGRPPPQLRGSGRQVNSFGFELVLGT